MKRNQNKKNDMSFRVTSIVVCVVMVLGLLPAPAIAEARAEFLVVENDSDEAIVVLEDSNSNLENFIVDASITSIKVEDGVSHVEPGVSYELKLTFAEREDMKFPHEGELTYTLPDGFEAAKDQPKLTSPIVVHYKGSDEKTRDAKMSVNTIYVRDGILHLLWNGSDSTALDQGDNAEFDVVVIGSFVEGTTTIPFANADAEANASEASETADKIVADAADRSLKVISEAKKMQEYSDGNLTDSELTIVVLDSRDEEANNSGQGALVSVESEEKEVASENPIETDVQVLGLETFDSQKTIDESAEREDDANTQLMDKVRDSQSNVVREGSASHSSKTEYVYEDSQIRVVAKTTSLQAFPTDVELRVRPVRKENMASRFDAYIEALNDASIGKHTQGNTLLYDVAFYDAEGKEHEPNGGTVVVSFEFKRHQLEDEIHARSLGEVEVCHLPVDNGNVLVRPLEASVSVWGETAAFETSSFSVFAFSYTVDFELGGYTYTLPGEGVVHLSELLCSLGIAEGVNSVEKVEFSNPDYVSLERDLFGNDWALRSLKAFNTHETLSIRMESGICYVVDVTDAQVSITQHPSNAAVSIGQAATFRVSASGTGLTYQWQTLKVGETTWIKTNLDGSTTRVLSFKATESLNGRKFRCVITDKNGATATSSAAKLTVCAKPVISSQPKSALYVAGKTATFTVSASGSGLKYQWETLPVGATSWIKTSLGGATTNKLSFEASMGLSGRKYRCVVTDQYGGSKTSSAATLTVKHEMGITGQPKNVAATDGQTVAFKVASTGDGLTYQWQTQKAGETTWIKTNLGGATTSKLSFAATTSLTGRKYRCVVKDKYGQTIISAGATLVVVAKPKFTTQPKSQTVIQGKTATLSVAASGTGLTYQWQTLQAGATSWIKTSLGGSTTNKLSFTATASLSGRKFRCVVTDANGFTITSGEAKLSVTSVSITGQPKARSVTEGQTATFSVAASGTGLTYQWQTLLAGATSWIKTNLGGSTTNKLSFTAALGYTGRRYRCVIKSSNGGSVISNAVTLTVVAKPKITGQPAYASVTDGQNAAFGVAATGTGLTYQWQTLKVGETEWIKTNLSGSTTNALNFTATRSLSGRKFRCLVTDKNGVFVTSNATLLTVDAKPKFTAHPKSVTVVKGQKATFAITATGANLTYQWQTLQVGASTWIRTSLNGSTTKTLSFNTASSYNGRKYRCVVTDRNGMSIISSEAMLFVKDPNNPIISLSTSKTSVLIDSNNNQVFTALSNVPVESMTLCSSETGKTYCAMYDDGNYDAHGDEIAGDGAFSVRFTSLPTSDSSLSFVARSGNSVSNAVVVDYYKSFTATELNQMQQVDTAISNLVNSSSYWQKTESARKSDAQALINQKISQGLIVNNSSKYDSSNGQYSFLYDSGVAGSISTRPFEDGMNGDDARRNASRKMNADEIVFNAMSEEMDSDEVGKALILNSFPAFETQQSDIDYRTDFYRTLRTAWNSKGLSTTLRDSNVTVSDYRSFGQYDVVCISTHGNRFTVWTSPVSFEQHSGICLAESVSNSKDTTYSVELKSHQIMKNNSRYVVLPKFFDEQYTNNSLNNTFVFSECCKFMGSDDNWDFTMANAIVGRGAPNCVGFHNSVFADYSQEFMRTYVNNLLLGRNSGDAYDVAKNEVGNNHREWYNRQGGNYDTDVDTDGVPIRNRPVAYPAIVGNVQRQIIGATAYNGIANGGFEETALKNPYPVPTSWKNEGDVRCLTQLGSIKPVGSSSSQMAMITTGIGSKSTTNLGLGTEGSRISQRILIPSHVSKLAFDYDFVSEEPMEYVGGKYNDSFEVSGKCDSSTFSTTLESVNGSSWIAVSGFDFSGGDATAYHTGWKKKEIDVSSYRGKVLSLKFTVYDVGDSYYDSAVLIDNVRLS